MIKKVYIEGLKDRTKKAAETSTELSKETSYQIKQELKESNQKDGPQQTTEVEELII